MKNLLRTRLIVWAAMLVGLSIPVWGYDGWMGGADCSTITGWAWDGALPNTPINVDIYDGTIPVATVSANLFRQDLLDAGVGNGFHSFSYPTPGLMKDNTTHYVRVYFGGTQTLIVNGANYNGEFRVCSEELRV